MTTLYVYVVITTGLQVPLAVVDSLYYGKFVLAPLNILWYNVFRRGGGPDLYGKTSLAPRPAGLVLVSFSDQLVVLVSFPDQLVGNSLIPRPAGWY